MKEEKPHHLKIGLVQTKASDQIEANLDKTAKYIIEAAEKEARGYYTGVFGYFDGENLDSGVMIRFIEEEGNKFFYRSGGGITTQSDLKSEYQEAIDKVYVPID